MQRNASGLSKRARTRRTTYVNQACNECKRRKVKCDGVRPCRRCASLSLHCAYSRHGAQSSSPPQSIATRSTAIPPHHAGLIDTANLPRREISDIEAESSELVDESPEFCGPSSSEYALTVVSGNLKALGIPTAILDKSSSMNDEGKFAISPLAHYGPLVKLLTMDPLWDWNQTDAITLINSWFDGVGSLYPVVCKSQLLDAADRIFSCLERARRGGPTSKATFAAEALFNNETNKLKAVLAIGRNLQSGGRNDQAQRLFQSISEAVEGLMWNSGGIDGIQLLVLVAIYHYHLDDEMRTGRIIGFAARSCLEMGLHRQEMTERLFPDPKKREIALKTFWSAYMFERRTSLGIGVPFTIQDSFVDSSLSELDTHDSILSALLQWTKIAGEAWHALNNQIEKAAEINRDNLDYLDYQINLWYQRLPDHLKLERSRLPHRGSHTADMYHQAVLYVRRSHLINLIHRPVLQTSTRIIANEKWALQAGVVARESITALSELHAYTSLISSQPLFFKHLLLTAFGNLLLAVVNAPQIFWSRVKEEFDMALDLIKLLSARSGPIMLLWRRLEGLQELQAQSLCATNTHMSQDNTGDISTDQAYNVLTFDGLFPSLPSYIFSEEENSSPSMGLPVPQMMEQVNGVFDALAGSNPLFDLFEDWVPS